MSGIIQGWLAAIFKPAGGVTPSNIFAWGINGEGQLGLGNTISRSSPVQVGALSTWASIAAFSHVAATTSSGALFTWGRNDSGQLGHNDRNSRSSPVQVGALTNWSLVAAGSNISSEGLGSVLAIKKDGTLWGWGRNDYGQLGQGTIIDRSSPVQVGALTDWVTVSTGGATSFAINDSGELYSWGSNQQGQLGLNLSNTPSSKRSSPVQVGALTNWASISAGGKFALAVKTDNTLWSWGYNNNGMLGIGTNQPKSSPVQVGALTDWAVAKAGGVSKHSLAVKTDNTLWSWGRNYTGQLGQNLSSTINKSSPVQVGALTVWEDVSAGRSHSLALRTVGSLWSFGSNYFGELGQNTEGFFTSRSSPVQVGASTDWLKPSAGVVISLSGKK